MKYREFENEFETRLRDRPMTKPELDRFCSACEVSLSVEQEDVINLCRRIANKMHKKGEL